jgi:hypothetical protein
MYEKDKLTVSQLFVEIYKNFNVSDQRENMKKLPKDELYYLLDTCIDSHDEDDLTVCQNFSPFADEIKNILSIHDNSILGNSSSLTDLDYKSITNRIYDNRVTENGDPLPKIYTKDEVRELKLNKIFDK